MKLIRITLLIAALALACGSAFAQLGERFSIGPRAALNFAKVNSDDFDTDFNTRYAFGVTATYSLNASFGVTGEFLYSAEGFDSEGGEREGALNYARIPVTFNWFFRNLGDNFRPKVYAGLAPGFLVSDDIEGPELTDAFNTFDLQGVAGLGFNYQIMDRTWINTDFRYFGGLTDVFDDEVTSIEGRNQNLQVSVGIAWGW